MDLLQPHFPHPPVPFRVGGNVVRDERVNLSLGKGKEEGVLSRRCFSLSKSVLICSKLNYLSTS